VLRHLVGSAPIDTVPAAPAATPGNIGAAAPRPLPDVGRKRKRPVVASLGWLLIVAGATVLLFVAYQLWGTGLREAASQRDLRAEFEQQLENPLPSVVDGGDQGERGAASRRAPSAVAAPIPPPPSPGEPVATLRIPKLGLDKVVVEGTDVDSLRKGPGHEPGTPMPGEPGNAVIAGHRTTYGAPFYRLDELAPGDPLSLDTPSGGVDYVVTGSQVVEPDDVWILEPTEDDRLTLFTCTPRFSAAQRLVVTARLVGSPVTTVAPPEPPASSMTEPAPTPASPPPRPVGGELAAPTGSVPVAVAWSLAAALTAAVVWAAGRRYRRLVAYPLGAPVVAVVLFRAFERIAELLPSAV
jgi:sortase A